MASPKNYSEAREAALKDIKWGLKQNLKSIEADIIVAGIMRDKEIKAAHDKYRIAVAKHDARRVNLAEEIASVGGLD